MMVEIKQLSGAPEYIEEQLSQLVSEGWDIIDITTNIYESTGGIRRDTTIYVKKTFNQ